MDIITACRRPDMFGPFFADEDQWANWFAFLKAVFALEMTEMELWSYQQFTGRMEPPAQQAKEVWPIIGRRGGKSRILALIGVYLALFKKYDQYLGPGEVATILILASTRDQARVIRRYVKGMLAAPAFAPTVKRDNDNIIELDNRVAIEIGAASFRSTRGYTFAAVLADEVAFWRSDESANPDEEILKAIRPGLLTIPHSMLLCASSPYARRGALFNAFKKHYGRNGKHLVWKADTLSMNLSIDPADIQAEYDEDPIAAAAEYGAEFRTDIEAFLNLDQIEHCIKSDYPMRRPEGRFMGQYCAFVDPSGGSSDSMTCAIAHMENDNTIVIDTILERRAPFNPEHVAHDFSSVLKEYGVSTVVGDRYAGEWPRVAFRKRSIEYQLSKLSKSELYLEMLPKINAGTVDLLRNQRLINQLLCLERRTARGGKDSIDHPPGGHDDVANCVAGVLQTTVKKQRRSRTITGVTLTG